MNYDGVANSLSIITRLELVARRTHSLSSLASFDPTPISGAVWACVGVLAKVSGGYTITLQGVLIVSYPTVEGD